MKRLKVFFGSIIGIIIILNLGIIQIQKKQNKTTQKTVTIYNWGDYIDPDLIKKFEKETGYQVEYETFDSNEAMYTKLKQGGTHYDVVIPSDYMIQKLKASGLLQKIDLTQVPNVKYIDSRFMNLSFDEHNQYSIPYFWGTLGIVYNDKQYTKNDVDSWKKLWKPQFKNKIMMIDGARELMGIGLTYNGNSINSKDPHQLQQAYYQLLKLMPNIKAIVSDEIKNYLITEEAQIAVTYSGEAHDMVSQNKHLHYVLPKEGTNLWFDNMVIPKNAQNINGAYAFINFMCEPQNAAQNARYIGYSTPNKAAKQLLGKTITSNQAFYPSEAQLDKMEVYQNLGAKMLQKYNDLFLELKMKH